MVEDWNDEEEWEASDEALWNRCLEIANKEDKNDFMMGDLYEDKTI